MQKEENLLILKQMIFLMAKRQKNEGDIRTEECPLMEK